MKRYVKFHRSFHKQKRTCSVWCLIAVWRRLHLRAFVPLLFTLVGGCSNRYKKFFLTVNFPFTNLVIDAKFSFQVFCLSSFLNPWEVKLRGKRHVNQHYRGIRDQNDLFQLFISFIFRKLKLFYFRKFFKLLLLYSLLISFKIYYFTRNFDFIKIEWEICNNFITKNNIILEIPIP